MSPEVPAGAIVALEHGEVEGLFVRVARALYARGGVEAGLRIGFLPLSALVDVSPEVAEAASRCELAILMQAAQPGAEVGRVVAMDAAPALEREINKLSDADLDGALTRLRSVAGETTFTRSPDELRKAALDAVRQRYAVTAGKEIISSTMRAKTAFDLIDKSAEQVDAVDLANRAFVRASGTREPATMRAAATKLVDTIEQSKGELNLKGKDVTRIRKALDTVVRGAERASIDSTAARAAFEQAFVSIKAGDPAGAMLGRVLPWLDESARQELAIALANLPPVPTSAARAGDDAVADQIRWRVNRIKGLLGELVAQRSRYRWVRAAELKRVRRFLETRAGANFEVLIQNAPLRMTTTGGTALALSYDDAIALLNKETGKVSFPLASEFKAGDMSSQRVFDQISRAEARESGGYALITTEDGTKQYKIEKGPLTQRRVFVATILETSPSEASIVEQVGGRDLLFVHVPVNPDDLGAAAEFLLRSVGIIK